ncbi:DEAD/DEAH box helicase [Candidatus Kuenenbacteria bacterium]|nr:DEAD/DEAH box helicase [Candidatus Kuenenbacteria bacterium]
MTMVNEQAFAYREEAYAILESNGHNILVIAPAGAGKTRVGYEALKKTDGGAYVAPTRALCLEKFFELKDEFPQNGIVLGNKDYTLTGAEFKGATCRVVTHYKLNQLLQNLGRRFSQVCRTVVLDEVQGLNNEMDIAITKLKILCPDVRIVSLCHTLHEDDEPKFAAWLNALIVKGTERPVPLTHRMVEFQADLTEDGEELSHVLVKENGNVLSAEDIAGMPNNFQMVGWVVKQIRESGDNEPIQIFTPYTEIARQLAELLASEINEYDGDLQAVADSLTAEASEFTQSLQQILPRGVAMHHGKMTQQEREVVQQLVNDGKINILVSCYTLTQGVNLPTKHLIFERIYDHDKETGEKRLIKPEVYHNAAGRAGRPNKQEVGVVWTLVANEIERTEAEEVLLKYKASRLESRIYDEYFLTSQVPQLILLGWNTPAKMAEFIRATFYGQTLQETQPLTDQFERIVSYLIDRQVCGVLGGNRIYLTNKGVQIARLGLHPEEFEIVDELSKTQNLDYAEWVRRLAAVTGEHVVRHGQPSEEDIEQLVTLGLTVYSTSGSTWNAKEMADYVSRIFETCRSYFQLNQMTDYAERWNELVYQQFTYGNLELCHKLAPFLKRDQIKRLIRNLGNALMADVLDDPAKRTLVRCLWIMKNGHAEDELAREMTQVANILGADADQLHSIYAEEKERTQTKITDGKEE